VALGKLFIFIHQTGLIGQFIAITKGPNPTPQAEGVKRRQARSEVDGEAGDNAFKN